MLNFKIADFPIAKRTINILLKAGIETLEQLEEKTVSELMDLPGMGKTSLGELRLFLSQSGFKLKKAAPAPKKGPKYDPRAKEILVNLVGSRVNNWAVEIKLANKLIELLGYDTMVRAKSPRQVDSLFYFFSGGQVAPWAEEYFKQFAQFKIVEPVRVEEEKKEEDKEPAFYTPKKSKPKTLQEFLNGIQSK